ncbi:hypothetical protein A1D29_02640 [Pasteurellaceae bacterium Orientalotternb1]|nr:hypothetical protein A1D29_02640 [Pasteurellaceae bacterium Orientalotternb1]
MKMFKYTTIALMISASVSTYASDPHQLIQLTPDISGKYTGKNVLLGVVDSGFMLYHPSLRNANITPLTFSLMNPLPNGGREYFDPSAKVISLKHGDDGLFRPTYSQHGGQVSGIINASASPNTLGGIAKDAHLYVATFEAQNPTTDDGRELGDSFLVGLRKAERYTGKIFAEAINQVAQHSVLAINNSWNERPVGDSKEEMDQRYEGILKIKAHSNPLVNAVRNAINKHDTLFVFAAGNEKAKQPGIMAALPRYFPEFGQHFLSVVATDGHNQLEEYSNACGVSKDWCISAPGTLTTLSVTLSDKGEEYFGTVIEQGTSYAAPTVTGSLAILKERFGYMSPTQVRDTLLTTATDLGEQGVDEQFGWGIVNVNKAINGPSQLLKDEVYQLDESHQDIWVNDLQSNNYVLTKSGRGQLTLRGQNKFNLLKIEQGRLDLFDTQAVQINNNANLAISGTLNSKISAEHSSHTLLNEKAHWVMSEDSTLGNVEMTEGSMITLNPSYAKTNSRQASSNYNTLTITNNLTGNGQFNFLTHLENWIGDKVIVNGLASGNFKLAVANTGNEPTSVNQLSLLSLNHADQVNANVNIELFKSSNVDFGAYRYQLLNEHYNYRLYNPLKEQELAEEKARQAEEARLALEKQKAEEEKARQAEEARLALEKQKAEEEKARQVEEAHRLAIEKQNAEEQRVRQAESLKKQAELISRYSNIALSDLSAQVSSLLTARHSLNQRLFDKANTLIVWTNVENQKNTHSSNHYRAYHQQHQLAEIGIQTALHYNADLGVVLSHSKTKLNFDNEGSGNNLGYHFTTFATKTFDRGFVAQAEFGIGKLNSKLNVDNQNADVSRNSVNAGIYLGYNWDIGLKVQPSIGLRYLRLQGAEYRLNNANVMIEPLHLLAYQAGLKLEKTWSLGNLALTPSLASYYVDTANKTHSVKVNNAKLTQQFGNNFSHELALATQWNHWEMALKAGLNTGNELHRQRYWGVNLGYHW